MNILWIIILVLLIAAVVGAPGIGPVQHNFGYAPSGILTIVVVVLVLLLLLGKL